MQKSLQQIIEDNASLFGLPGSEYVIRVSKKDKIGIHCYIRPSNRDGETVNFIINGNRILSEDRNKRIKQNINDLLDDGN